MGLQFGNLIKLKRIVYFRLSPHEQKAFKGFLSHGSASMMRRFHGNIYRVAPPFVISYLVYTWGNEEYRKTFLKNPDDYKDDV